ncbi:MAG: RnfABCDGE type electron transport complex subunit B [Burkholderiaceae bacterium]|nr:RnfABCDGE type electron transport complex subunit B [Burkholderiaceae bacterium]
MSARNARRIARIDPQRCIGCTRCIDACPFDAIIGAAQRMHTVIDADCIGCELCVAPCPVDCITLDVAQPPAPLDREHAVQARARRARRDARLAREAAEPLAPGIDAQAIVAAALQRSQVHHVEPLRPGKAIER